ncbi:consortin, connexin sorting protein b [Pempheris klunzingeri]|uniref:consortin, connexin sorting protein b n=1 Tax=Pempheris klunzingeri TaxID=3127111 RepID=UPI00397FE2F8
MGNKNAIPPKGPDTGEWMCTDSATGSASRDGPLGPSPELLASLQSLRENSDFTLLPHSLHQIAEAYSLKEDYQWAIQFLQLEKLYHERLLSNLAALQENWESQWREKSSAESSLASEVDGISQKHIETLQQICRTHCRPSVSEEQKTLNAALKDIQSRNDTLQPCHDNVNLPETTQQGEEQEQATGRREVRRRRKQE